MCDYRLQIGIEGEHRVGARMRWIPGDAESIDGIDGAVSKRAALQLNLRCCRAAAAAGGNDVAGVGMVGIIRGAGAVALAPFDKPDHLAACHAVISTNVEDVQDVVVEGDGKTRGRP